MGKNNIFHEILKGGDKKDSKSFPTGGFPSIIICSKKQLEEEEKNNNREFETKTSTVSIKDILFKRRNDIPVV
jgi:hypothetical protein